MNHKSEWWYVNGDDGDYIKIKTTNINIAKKIETKPDAVYMNRDGATFAIQYTVEEKGLDKKVLFKELNLSESNRVKETRVRKKKGD